jgi:hypothetical protein
MTYSYTTDVKDENGVTIIPDLDVELDLTVTLSGGELTIEVVGVYMNTHDEAKDINMMISKSPTIRAIGCDIAGEAESDPYIIQTVMQEEGYAYRGLGGNDPDGHIVRVRQ